MESVDFSMAEELCGDCKKITAPESGLFSGRNSSGGPESVPSIWSRKGCDFTVPTVDDRIEAVALEFKSSVKDMIASAEKGCPICSHFVKILKNYAERSEDLEKSELLLPEGIFSEWKGSLVLTRNRPEAKTYENLIFGDIIALKLKGATDISLIAFSICTSELDDTNDCGITRRLVSRFTGSSECMDYVAKRLKHCRQNHPQCLATNRSNPPTRLLDVGSVRDQSGIGRLRLVITADSFPSGAPYIALSYCWGSPSQPPFTTTSVTLDARKDGICYSDLPAAFKDAVEIARYLNIKYLWIDSLCILQDSADDWAIESSKMGDYYHHATLTIAASMSTDSYQAILRNDRKTSALALRLPLQVCSTVKDGPIVMLMQAPRHFGSRPAVTNYNELLGAVTTHFREPLGSRAWTLQERLLSRRTIFYDKNQMLWECNTSRYFEGWTFDLNQIPLLRGNFHHVEKPRTWEHEEWYTILTNYRSRHLTITTDALPALAGFAAKFAENNSDEYLAGLWRRDIFRGLSWRMEHYHDYDTSGRMLSWRKKHRYDFGSRSFRQSWRMKHYLEYKPLRLVEPLRSKHTSIDECFAPSWSWASVFKSIEQIFRSNSWHSDTLLYRCHYSPTEHQNEPLQLQQPKLINTCIISRNSDKMSHVTSAILVIEALCRTVVVRLLQGRNHPYGQYPGKFVFEMEMDGPKYLNQYLFPCIDHPSWLGDRLDERGAGGWALTCLLLGCTSGLYCLLIYPADDYATTKHYRRCGVLNIEYQALRFKEGWEVRTVSLV